MVSPPQRPYQQALDCALQALRERPPAPDVLESLGARSVGEVIHVQALEQILEVNLARASVTVVGEGGPVRTLWAVLVLHYLGGAGTPVDTRVVSFGAFHDGSSYASVFQKRVTGRFLASVGRSEGTFIAASERHGGVRLGGDGVGYRFAVLPRLPIAFFRYEGDTELAAGASVVYQADAEFLLPAEDRVVAADLLLDALAGKPMTEPGGAHENRT